MQFKQKYKIFRVTMRSYITGKDHKEPKLELTYVIDVIALFV